MSIEDAIYSRLSTFAALELLVTNRIYPQQGPQGVAKPYIVYGRISTERISALGADTDIAQARFQFNCYSDTYDNARDVFEQVRAAMQRWKGTEAGITIEDSFIETERDEYEQDTTLFYVIADIIIIYRE